MFYEVTNQVFGRFMTVAETEDAYAINPVFSVSPFYNYNCYHTTAYFHNLST